MTTALQWQLTMSKQMRQNIKFWRNSLTVRGIISWAYQVSELDLFAETSLSIYTSL